MVTFASSILSGNISVVKQLLKIGVKQGLEYLIRLMGQTSIPSALQLLLLLREVKADITSQVETD